MISEEELEAENLLRKTAIKMYEMTNQNPDLIRKPSPELERLYALQRQALDVLNKYEE